MCARSILFLRDEENIGCVVTVLVARARQQPDEYRFLWCARSTKPHEKPHASPHDPMLSNFTRYIHVNMIGFMFGVSFSLGSVHPSCDNPPMRTNAMISRHGRLRGASPPMPMAPGAAPAQKCVSNQAHLSTRPLMKKNRASRRAGSCPCFVLKVSVGRTDKRNRCFHVSSVVTMYSLHGPRARYARWRTLTRPRVCHARHDPPNAAYAGPRSAHTRTRPERGHGRHNPLRHASGYTGGWASDRSPWRSRVLRVSSGYDTGYA